MKEMGKKLNFKDLRHWNALFHQSSGHIYSYMINNLKSQSLEFYHSSLDIDQY